MMGSIKTIAAWAGTSGASVGVIDDVKHAFLTLFYWAWKRVPRIDGFGTGTSIVLYFFAGLLVIWIFIWAKGVRERRP